MVVRKLQPKADYSQPAVQCSDVTFSYTEGQRAIHNLFMRIESGEKIGIIGPNGAGKSTFLTLLNGLRECHGDIRIFGVPVDRENSRIIKSMVGLVFQNPDDQLFSPTVYEDVAFGPLNMGLDEKETEERVFQALEEVGLKGYAERFGLHLSYGERKLAAIATILSMMPDIIAMDEPTSTLDPAHRRIIINWIRGSNRTFMLTSHDLDMILETCSRVYIFNKGTVVASGKTAEILTDRDLLAENDLELPLCLQHKNFLEIQ